MYLYSNLRVVAIGCNYFTHSARLCDIRTAKIIILHISDLWFVSSGGGGDNIGFPFGFFLYFFIGGFSGSTGWGMDRRGGSTSSPSNRLSSPLDNRKCLTRNVLFNDCFSEREKEEKEKGK